MQKEFIIGKNYDTGSKIYLSPTTGNYDAPTVYEAAKYDNITDAEDILNVTPADGYIYSIDIVYTNEIAP